MTWNIQLSKKASILLQQLGLLPDNEQANTASVQEMINWISLDSNTLKNIGPIDQKEPDFLLASLRVVLLKDLHSTLDTSYSPPNKEFPSWSTKLKFAFFAIAGAIAAACSGFDIMASLLGSVSAPSTVILLAGLVFSGLSIIIFCGFNLVQVSMNFNIKLINTPKLLKNLLAQRDELKNIRRAINALSLSLYPVEELDELKQILHMLDNQGNLLSNLSSQFNDAIHSPGMKIIKFILSGLAGSVFVLGGFLSGQTVAVFMLGLFLGSVAPTAWPVIVAGLVIGAAAFCLYWYVERVGLEKLIGSWFGLDEEKIEILCNESKINKEKRLLSNLKNRVQDMMTFKDQHFLEPGVSQKISNTTGFFSVKNIENNSVIKEVEKEQTPVLIESDNDPKFSGSLLQMGP